MSDIRDSVIVTPKFSYWMSHDILKVILLTYRRFRGPGFRGYANFEKFHDKFVPNEIQRMIKIKKNEFKEDVRGIEITGITFDEVA